MTVIAIIDRFGTYSGCGFPLTILALPKEMMAKDLYLAFCKEKGIDPESYGFSEYDVEEFDNGNMDRRRAGRANAAVS